MWIRREPRIGMVGTIVGKRLRMGFISTGCGRVIMRRPGEW